jgi:hypothetical protein
MLDEFIDQHPTETLTTYTRNPHILTMIGRIASNVYPLTENMYLQELATEMQGATVGHGAVYHLNRYGEQGVFRGGDPAEGTSASYPKRLNERFTKLTDVRHALVVAASLPKETRR